MELANREAEYSVIGIAMTDAVAADKLAVLPPDTFTFPATQRMHRGVAKLRADNKQVDMLTLCDAVRSDDFAPEADAIEAAQMGISPAMYRQYETILLNLRKRRNAMRVARGVLNDLSDPQMDVHTVVDSAIQSLSEGDGIDESLGIRDALMHFVDGLSADTRRVPTGIADVDAMTGGLSGGQLVIIGARPGVGKSAMVINMVLNAALKGKACLFVSKEMNSDEILTRMVARESGVDSMRISNRTLTVDEHVQMAPCYEEISRLRIEINTRVGTPMEIRRAATAMKNSVGLDLIVVDYLGLLNADGKTNSRYEAVSDISRALKTMAMDMDIPIVALAQLNRGSEVADGKTNTRMPTLADFRDSGSIEQDANICLLLWNPPEPREGKLVEAWHLCERAGYTLVQVNLAKNRQGRTGVFNLAFDKAHMRFVSIRGD